MRKQLIAGMPESGKSTYIGALRHVLVAKQVDTELEMNVLAGEEKHLNLLEDKWLALEEMERTKTSNEAWVEINLRDRSTGEESLVTIPDLRGENFERPASAGLCPKNLYDAVVASDGIMFFTNVNKTDDTLLIDEFSDISDDDDEAEGSDIAPDVSEGDDNQNTAANVAEKFKPEDMAEEVKIVEFLQVANRRPLEPKRRKLAVIASAWDLVATEEGITPDSWLSRCRPMLAQFLTYNADLWELRIYGVSAQGGKLPERKAEFNKMMRPSERVLVVGHGAAIHDLTAPLRWLMAG
jgi:Double-GTPase 1